MTAEETFDQAATDIFNKLGVDGVYHPNVGDPVSLKVNVEKGNILSPDDFEMQTWQPGITIEAILENLGKEPDIDETIVVGSTTYTVASVIENDGRFCKVEVTE